MQTLGLDDETRIVTKNGFWRRQFQQEATRAQNKFDWVFGVVLPVACFFFDPVVFESGSSPGALLGTYKPFAYLLSFVSVMAMMAWLLGRERLKALNAVLSGLFAVGGIISLIIGIVLFPFSLLGLVIIIGALGFTPLLTAFVFIRNSIRSAHAARAFIDSRSLVYSGVLAAIFATVVPYVVNVEINRRVDAMLNGDAVEFQENARVLRFVAPLMNMDKFRQRLPYAYGDVPKNARQKAIEDFYRQVKGMGPNEKVFAVD